MTEPRHSLHEGETDSPPITEKTPARRSWRRSRRKAKAEAVDVPDEKKEDFIKPVGLTTLFRFATRVELALNGVGLLLAVGAGAAQPLMTLFFGEITKAFTQYGMIVLQISMGDTSGDTASALSEARRHLKHEAGRMALWLTLIGIGNFTCTYLYMLIYNWTSERQARRIREKYLHAVLRQEVDVLDNIGAGEIASRIQSDTLLVQIGIGEKIPIASGYISTFITGYVLAYVRSPRMGGVLTSVLPAIMIAGLAMDLALSKYTAQTLHYTGKASSLAEEAISSIRTVQAFASAKLLGERFDALIEKTRKIGNKNAIIDGTGVGVMFFAVYAAYALAFYYGGVLYAQGKADVSVIINVLLAIIIGSFTLAMITPELQAVAKGQAAAAKLFQTIDSVPIIDSASDDGLRLPPNTVLGHLALENVSFRYPSRPDIPIFADLSLSFDANKTYALVGASGSGKSTVIQLLERFYDPLEGRVTFDGHDLRSLNVGWLRQQMGLVSQEPTLFSTSVRSNIEFGLVGSSFEDASDEERFELVKQACITANAHDFVSQLPLGYDTQVGERGMLLSGGQKQRIAIARAIIGNPRILLLDEATSALDANSERVVQDALDKASRGRTTIVIAHRLSTIKDSDCILVMGSGGILESGTHEELIAAQGVYAQLVINQKVALATAASATTEGTPALDTPGSDKRVGGPTHAELKRANSTLTTSEHKDGKEKRVGFAPLFIRLVQLGRQHWPWYFVGLVGSIAVGVSYPAVAILFGKSIAAFENPDRQEVKRSLSEKALWYFIAALGSGIVCWFQMTPFSQMGWNTAAALRTKAFRAIMRHDVEWFDRNEAGSVTASLAEDPQKVQGLFGMTLGQILASFATIGAGVIIGLVYAPLLAAVGIASIPLIFTSGYVRLRVVELKDQRAKKTYSTSTQLATEAAGSIRTVASLTREKLIVAEYSQALDAAEKISIRAAWKSQALYAASQAIAFFIIALVFYIGALWLAEGRYSTEKFFICLEAVIFSAIQAGSMFMFVPDASRAATASRNLFKLFNNKPEIDAFSPEGTVLDPAAVGGEIRFNNVTFRYPSRPDVRVLKELSFEIPSGKYVALVGPSGCGKSTTVQLIERFYDPLSGSITLDGVDIRNLNVASYRSAIALVSQEPTLYTGSIRFNILLGALDADAVTDAQMAQACRDANIADFVASLPAGLDTEVGGKGVQLSGGQKQRVALARALIRNPRVLLLDEATAALDSASERVVQDALDNAATGRSVLAIAHRLSTIQRADIIYYLAEGRVAEKGTHQELLARRGAYFDLVQKQTLTQT
ncbi:multidrug efflux pump [Cutaneotrichosporon oleaginosum]|uniref:Multidrug efflux pump n=1 Tax=Cutaneotrichosporon oleaginosum TaxID=879819 RepID=A0A0J1B9A5_9TREE|nr:multidrug efflux pump [Cutaneotrichosporon oleaginosum]KLT44389.1 multidrug efflux pump [Cutaneotrichosporon oleaginosum]TXT07888.1 hypothetical protein COLE_04812 [Cutaneotrichosporon oleaginosum]